MSREEFKMIHDILKSMQEDLGKVKERVYSMPCDVHKEKFKSYDIQFRIVWTIITLIIAGMGILKAFN